MADELTMDALVVLKCYFGGGPKTTLEVGGKHAQSRLSTRGRAALDELTKAGFLTVEPVGKDGRQKFTGTDKERPRITGKTVAENGRWSIVEPNPKWKEPKAGAPR